uniref:Pleckstrin homology domain containing O2 n=1 Tax=Latimeria chalumnae TaxID=7897 RepID=H3A7V7_LATCH
DIKFLAPSLEDKNSWIEALNKAIGRAKNRAFDEVTVDKSCALEHVTRDRVKVSHARRPPTRYMSKGGGARRTWGCESVTLLKFNYKINPPSPILMWYNPPSPCLQVAHTAVPTSAVELSPSPSYDYVRHYSPPPRSTIVPTSAADGSLALDLCQTDSTPNDNIPAPNAIAGEPPPKQVLKPPMPPTKKLTPPANQEITNQGSEETPGATEHKKPPTPPPKILSNSLKMDQDNTCSEEHVEDISETSVLGSQEDLRWEDDKEMSETTEDNEEKEEEEETEAKEEEEEKEEAQEDENQEAEEEMVENDEGEVEQDPSDGNVKQEEKEETAEVAKQSTVPLKPASLSKPQSVSLEDLLSGPRQKAGRKELKIPFSSLSKDHLDTMQDKVTWQLEKTEELLQKALKSPDPVDKPDGQAANAERLLNEAKEQLKQASQVLQEINELKEICKSKDLLTAEQKERRKMLLTEYRKSLP